MSASPFSPLILATVLLAALPARADEMRSVPSGQNRQIDFFASVNPDCTAIGRPTIRLIEGPDRGVVTTDKGRDFMAFARSNIRYRCNRTRIPGLKMFYQSETGFFGTDRVRILIISGSGTEREATYAIRVR